MDKWKVGALIYIHIKKDFSVEDAIVTYSTANDTHKQNPF